MPPIDLEYRPYFLTQRIEQTRKFAESGKTADVITTMVELLGSCDDWWRDTARKFGDFARLNYRLHHIGHLPALPVAGIVDAWIQTDPSILPPYFVPEWGADELYLAGWLAIFAHHEDYATVDARVEFDPAQEEFVIRGIVKMDDGQTIQTELRLDEN